MFSGSCWRELASRASASIQEALRRLGPGDLLQVTVLRDGKLEQLSASYQP